MPFVTATSLGNNVNSHPADRAASAPINSLKPFRSEEPFDYWSCRLLKDSSANRNSRLPPMARKPSFAISESAWILVPRSRNFCNTGSPWAAGRAAGAVWPWYARTRSAPSADCYASNLLLFDLSGVLAHSMPSPRLVPSFANVGRLRN